MHAAGSLSSSWSCILGGWLVFCLFVCETATLLEYSILFRFVFSVITCPAEGSAQLTANMKCSNRSPFSHDETESEEDLCAEFQGAPSWIVP